MMIPAALRDDSSAARSFRLGGVSVHLTSTDRHQVEQIHLLLSRLFTLGSGTAFRDVLLDLHATPLPETTGRMIYSAKSLIVRTLGSAFQLSCGRSQLCVTPTAGTVSCFLASDFLTYSPFEQREFFLLGLLMLLRPQGCYGLHACGLERRGVGLLLVGISGSGKTTTSLNLLRQGWQYLSDDAVLLTTLADGAVQAAAFRRGFSCTPETLARFPDLTGDAEFGDPGGKRIVYPGDTFGGFVETCTPSLIVFPKVTAAAQTSLRHLSAAHSLIYLSQQSAGIMTDAEVSQRQLELLKNLTVQTRSFELLLGRDALDDPSRVDALIRSVSLEQVKEATSCVSLSS